jgi:hypothetical protein
MRYWAFNVWCIGILLCLGLAVLGVSLAQPSPQNSPQVQVRAEDTIRDASTFVALAGSPEPIYSQDPHDAWNRIFYYLFSRRVQTRLSDDFPEGAPFRMEGEGEGLFGPGIRISTRVFERTEIGDRAIDPLYPSFWVGAGGRLVLADPAYPEFAAALRAALGEKAPRPALARALMQNDLWAAYDILSGPFLLAGENELGQHRHEALDLLARLIRKIALTPEEIKALPNNYSVAVEKHSFPDVFGKDSGWIEVQWFPERTHDVNAGYRRVSRVFLKPVHLPRDMQEFLSAKPGQDAERTAADLDGVALVTELLLIDTQGNIEPTTLTTEIQVRRFEKTEPGVFKKTTIQVCEISRKQLLLEPESGGLAEEDENSAAYLGGYGFAEGQPIRSGQVPATGQPLQVRLRTRCARCHGGNLAQVNTFGVATCTQHCPPGYRIPEVRQLNPNGSEAADFDIAQKNKRAGFEALQKYFRWGYGSRPCGHDTLVRRFDFDS